MEVGVAALAVAGHGSVTHGLDRVGRRRAWPGELHGPVAAAARKRRVFARERERREPAILVGERRLLEAVGRVAKRAVLAIAGLAAIPGIAAGAGFTPIACTDRARRELSPVFVEVTARTGGRDRFVSDRLRAAGADGLALVAARAGRLAVRAGQRKPAVAAVVEANLRERLGRVAGGAVVARHRLRRELPLVRIAVAIGTIAGRPLGAHDHEGDALWPPLAGQLGAHRRVDPPGELSVDEMTVPTGRRAVRARQRERDPGVLLELELRR